MAIARRAVRVATGLVAIATIVVQAWTLASAGALYIINCAGGVVCLAVAWLANRPGGGEPAFATS